MSPDRERAAGSLPIDRAARAMESTQTGFWEWDIRQDHVRWSDMMGPLYGLEPGAQPGSYGDYLAGLVPEEERAVLDAQVRAAVERGRDYTRESRVVLPDGSERWLHSRAHVLRGDDGEAAALIGVTTDVTEAREREAALRFLAEASAPLFGSLDPWATLQQIADLAVPSLGDWCVIQTAADVRGSFENVAVAHVDPDKVRWARELEERYPADPDATTGAPQVIRSGRSELYPTIDPELLRAGAIDAAHLEILQTLQMSSAMIVPLRARERVLGAITFVYAESRRHYGEADLEQAEVLGRRAGLALDHARMYARERSTAELLQRALLPAALPEIDGYELAVCYRPSSEGDHAGGDWYDAFPIGNGRFGIVIGDIGGRGIAAAASMGQLRNAIRAYALDAPDASSVIANLRRLADALDADLFATVIFAVLDAASGDLAVASAGHLPPLLVDGEGRGAFLDFTQSPPLGTGPSSSPEDATVTLGRGAALVLYTDGLVETRDAPIDHGLEELRAAASVLGDAEAIVEAAMTVTTTDGDDDVAVLTLRRLP